MTTAKSEYPYIVFVESGGKLMPRYLSKSEVRRIVEVALEPFMRWLAEEEENESLLPPEVVRKKLEKVLRTL